MKPTINIYCDESCHLQNDKEPVMVIGAVYCPIEKKEEIFERLYSFKLKHNLIPKIKRMIMKIELIMNLNGTKFQNQKLSITKM